MDSLNYLGKTKQELIKEFQQFYYKKAAPLLPDYEQKRNQDKYNVYAVNAILVGFILILVGFKTLKFVGALLVFVPLLIIFLRNGIGSTVKVEMDYENNLKSELMPEFLSLFGEFKWSKSSSLMDGNEYEQRKQVKRISEQNKLIYKTLTMLRVMPIFHLFSIDDTIEGFYHNVGVRLLETKIGYKAINILTVLFFAFVFAFVSPIYILICSIIITLFISILSIFSQAVAGFFTFITILLMILLPIILVFAYFIITGSMRCLIVELDMNKNFHGNTCVYEKALTNKKLKFRKRADLQEVRLEDTRFNSIYKVESTDQIEARYLLTTAFIERFLKIKTAFKAEYIRAEFKNDKLYLILGVNKDLFAMGNISKKTTSKTFVELFEELYSVLSLIDELKLNQKIGL